jgi:N-acetylglucosaminyldiphosphoundecaprenol N-acetyl-beta-D-mannosaminyltransferase
LRHAGAADLETRHLFGLDFVTGSTVREVVDALLADSDRRPWRCVVTPNVDHLVRYQRYPDELETARLATVVLPDGMPIVWASRLLGRPLTGRLTGADLFTEMWPRLAAAAVPVVVIAADDEVAARLRSGNPQARCIVPPLFDVADQAAVSSLLDSIDIAIAEVRARFVVVGVSMPKHHLLARHMRERWDAAPGERPTVMLLGASPNLALGLTPRAPQWMQSCGLEWLYRLWLEPRRLARRYLIDDVAFVRLLWREWKGSRGR